MLTHKLYLAVLRGLTVLAVPAFGDVVWWGAFYGGPQILRSGLVSCRQEVRQNGVMILGCSRGSETLFTVNDFADSIAASDYGKYIAGLSNRGSDHLFWLRDTRGKVIQIKSEFYGPYHWKGIYYCGATASNVREWFDAKDPNVRFQFTSGKLAQVLVRSCDGRDLRMMKP